jgi:hypothetical protein
MLENLLNMKMDDFVHSYWLQKPLLLQQSAAWTMPVDHPARMMPLDDIKSLLRRKKPRPARFLHDVDVTRYVNGRRSALSNGSGVVDSREVWTAFERDGYSIRIVHPQQWHQAAYELCSCLQELFGSTVGCSAYLTPKASQGFPPHYDDVEVFVLQLEGSKRWRLYERPDTLEHPAADRTTEFGRDELGEPTATLTLHPGDLLYLPRGVVHQALAQEDGHSLHLTFSTYQRHTWRDLLADPALGLSARAEAALAALRLPRAAEEEEAEAEAAGDAGEAEAPGAVSGDVLRGFGLLRDLPLDLILSHTAGQSTLGWEQCGAYLVPPLAPFWLTQECWEGRTMSTALDLHALRFLQHSLPPLGCGAGSTGGKGGTTDATGAGEDEPELNGASRLRLRAQHCARLVEGSGGGGSELSDWEAGTVEPPPLALHTNVLNGRSFAEPPSPAFEVLPGLARSVLHLLSVGGDGACIKDLPAYRSGDGGGDDGTSGADDAEALALRRSDLFDLLELLVEHGVLVVMEGGGSVGDGGGGDGGDLSADGDGDESHATFEVNDKPVQGATIKRGRAHGGPRDDGVAHPREHLGRGSGEPVKRKGGKRRKFKL